MKYSALFVCLAMMSSFAVQAGHCQIRQTMPRPLGTQVPARLNPNYGKFNFQLSLTSSGGVQLFAGFQECLGLEAEATDIKKVVLKNGAIHRLVLDEWLTQMRIGAPEARRTIIVRLMNSDRTKVLKSWQLAGAGVDDYQAMPELSADANAIGIASIELSYESWERDPLP